MADIYGVVKSYLEITFADNFKGSCTINIPNPREDITEAEIKDLATFILDNKLFLPRANGAEMTGILKAKVVTSDTDKFDLA
ncbi:MAG: DUF2922 domain-containing protein [Paraclostridium sp.]